MEISKAEMSAAAASAANPSNPQDLRGSEILVKALQAEGVKYVWGYPGGAVLHIYDAFYKQDTIQHVLVRHEQAAVHAADGYARATGDVGVALVTLVAWFFLDQPLDAPALAGLVLIVGGVVVINAFSKTVTE